jgi:hypothetical protein
VPTREWVISTSHSFTTLSLLLTKRPEKMYPPFSWRRLLLLCLPIILLSYIPVITAQSTQCHGCILKAIPMVEICATLTSAQLATLDRVIHGGQAFTTPSAGFQCLVSLMWDVVHYKAKLWGHCLDSQSACPWTDAAVNGDDPQTRFHLWGQRSTCK